ncbi:MAG: metal-dependent hydrolase [Legionellaceae bacterium]|nr:metal-dependent hydrolase [Legionellaceae bacterium]
MDPITQGALGAAAAQTILGHDEHRPHQIWLAGALGGMAADLDIVIRSTHDPLLSLLYHRHFTHSLSFILPGGLLVALFLVLFPYFRTRWTITLCAAIIGYATHGVLDACTSYGTVLYWPWSTQRISWDWIFIIDPFFTTPLVVGIAFTVIYHQKKGAVIGLFLALLFMAFCARQHSLALTAASHYFQKHRPDAEHIRVVPEAPAALYWRAIARTDSQLLQLQLRLSVLGTSTITGHQAYPLFNEQDLPNDIRHSASLMRDFTVFDWFTDGYLIKVKDQPLTLADGRYVLAQKPPRSLWGIIFFPDKPHITKKYFIIVRPET